MRYKRVFLIKPSYGRSFYGAFHPPVGLGYIAENLAYNDIAYDMVDMGFNYPTKNVLQKIEAFGPDLLGVTMMSFMYLKTHQLIREIKRTFPHIHVVIGGAHGSCYREKALDLCPDIDYVITFEGDEAIVDLCQGLPLNEIKGLIYRNTDGQKIYNGDRKFIQDLDKIPFPRYDKFELSKYIFNDIDISSSRGCPHRCTFCSVKMVAGRQLRFRSADNVVDEIAYWYERGYRKFNFVDDNFTFKYDRVYAICDEIEKRGFNDLKITNANGIRADRADRDLLKRMREIGFYYIGFGVECGNDKILKNIKKGEKMAQIREAIETACDLGYDVVLNFLIGSPGEAWEDIEDSVALALEYPVMDVRFNNITPTPRSELFDWLEEKSYFVQTPEQYLNNVTSWSYEPVYYTPELSVEEKRRALLYTRKIRKQVLKKAFIRKMKRLGPLTPLAKLAAPIVVSDHFMNAMMYSPALLRIAERIRGK
ncbi:MAG: radical SAM protein [Thermodesulfobacteriota bacterium]|nr:radical SAM protein [Thermodesulfobacteriota bacterium]